MIKNNIDYALVGHNYLTFLLSEGLINRQKNVLLLDDERFNYGDFFTSSLTELDMSFISKYGELNKSEPLINIKKYISIEERTFYLGKRQIILGKKPSQNYKELCRKFPELFDVLTGFSFSSEEEASLFDTEFENFCLKVTDKIFNSEKKIKLFQIFEESAPKNLKDIFENFIKKVENRKNVENEDLKFKISSFIYMGRGFYQSHFSITGTKVELIHLLICLLSPYYCLDYKLLNQELLDRFTKLGGDFKKLNLADLKFQRGNLKGIELESYDGLVNPKKIIFVGGHPIGLPIRFERPKNVYNCLNVKIKCSNIPSELINKKIIFSSTMKISTARPLFEIQFNENHIEANIVVLKKNGIKVEFIHKSILDELKLDLKYIYPQMNFDFVDAQMSFTHDIFIEEFTDSHKIKNELKIKNKLTELMFFIDPIFFNRPKNVFYLGPYNDGFLGTLSSLIEINKWQKEI